MNTENHIVCDVLVVGSGAGGMAAAITAACHGLRVMVVEKETQLGGGTAYSYGTLWVPANPVTRRAGIIDSRKAARTYLRHKLGDHFDAERVDAYLENGPGMVDFFEKNTAVRFFCRSDYPDYAPELPGALAEGGRTIVCEPVDARGLSPSIAKLRRPLYTQTLFGMMYSPLDIERFQTSLKSPRSFAYLVRRATRHWRDMLVYGRTMFLTSGNALAARLIKSADDLRIPLWVSSTARELITVGGAVRGAIIDTPQGQVQIEARRGVVLACGGFGHDLARCSELFAHVQAEGRDWSMAPSGNTGDGLRLAQAVGAKIDRSLSNGGFWAPVSRVPGACNMLNGHYHERQRPGFIAVLRNGRRFANEAASYHDFGEAIVRACGRGEEPVAFIIGDHASVRRVGLGFAKPRPLPLSPHLRSGYMLRGRTVKELADAAGIDAVALAATVNEFNRHAREGLDPQFMKGSNSFHKYFADPNHAPNGCVGPLEHPPFYAVRITVGHMGTLAEIKTDRHARALDDRGASIPGLYIVGNDMANVFGGTCPGGGITLGPAMTFGFVAARHMAAVAQSRLPREERPEELAILNATRADAK